MNVHIQLDPTGAALTFKNAADNFVIGKHVEIVIVPLCERPTHA